MSTTTSAAASDAAKAARAAGRGGVAVLAAKVSFILSGFVQTMLLPAIIGQAGFGALALVLAPANIVNNVMVASGTQGVSRMVARAKEHEGEALRLGLRVHAALAIVAGAALRALRPAYGAFERAPHIVVPLATMAGVTACYGFYAALVGGVNGRAEFGTQAALDVTFATLAHVRHPRRRVALLPSRSRRRARRVRRLRARRVAHRPHRAARVRRGRAARGAIADVPSWTTYLAALLPIAVAQLFTNLVMQVDISLLGRFLSEGAPTPKAADEWVAVYRECQLFAFLPYQLLFSVTQVLFPYVARAHAAGDSKAVAAYVARGARIGAIACGLLVAVIAGMPGSLLRFAYSSDVATQGASVLRVLALGQGCFAMLGLAATVLVSLGREREAALITAVTLVLLAAGCYALSAPRAFGAPQLAGAALATSLGLLAGLAIAAARVRVVAGAFIPWAAAARVVVAVGAIVAVGTKLPRVGRFVAPLEAIVVAVVYVAILLATREIGADDVALVKGLVAKKRA